MAEIASASEQQREGIEQINKAVEQMNQATQATAAGAEESASAAEELSSQAAEMMSMVKTFQLTTGSRKIAPRPAIPTHPIQKAATRAFNKQSRAEQMIPFASSDDRVLADF
jgi:hypothetical protein